MYLPPVNLSDNKEVQVQNFFGYDQRDKLDDRQFSYMKNMSGDAIPAAAPRKPRLAVASAPSITALCAPQYKSGGLDAFTGVADRHFYYEGTKINNLVLSSGEKSIADFNGKLCIFPDKLYYNYLPDPETGEVVRSLQKMENEVTAAGMSFSASLDDLTGAYDASIQKSGAGFDTQFSAGDSVVISGCTTEKNNSFIADSRAKYAPADAIISAVVEEATRNKLSLRLYHKDGSLALFQKTTEKGSVTVKVYIPDMDHVCVHNNRLWGTAKNGEYLYASKLGDCMNFNSFQGLTDDSWYSAVGTDGGFTGIVSYRSAVVALKRSYIHHVYGDSPQNFSIPKQTFGGTVDGRSVTELGGVLYYLSGSGFCAYAGGEPERISPNIRTRYITCRGGTDGKKYYACATREDNSCDVLVYDPDYHVWHREDDADFVDFLQYNGALYGATANTVYRFGEGEEEVSWCVVSKRFTLDTTQHKGVSCIYLRLDLAEGSTVHIYTSRDDGDFEPAGVVSGDGFLVHRLPVRFGKCDSFRIMLEGTGNAVVHDIEIVNQIGGKNNGINRQIISGKRP